MSRELEPKTPNLIQTNVWWAIFDRHDKALFVNLARNEKDIWVVFSGWGSDEEIGRMKTSGMRASRVDIAEQKETENGPQ